MKAAHNIGRYHKRDIAGLAQNRTDYYKALMLDIAAAADGFDIAADNPDIAAPVAALRKVGDSNNLAPPSLLVAAVDIAAD